MIYKVNEDHQGAVMIGDRSYRPSQIIRDDGTSPKLTKSIEKLLKLNDCPITLVEDKQDISPSPSAPTSPDPSSKSSKEKGSK